MRGPGKHRRPKNAPLARGIAAVGLTGSAALALPLAGAGTAGAATPDAAPSVAVAKQTLQSNLSVAPSTAPAALKATPVKYSVVAGDSLSVIAHKYGVQGGWKKLYKDNRRVVGSDPRLIHPGQKLSVAGTAAKVAKAAKAAAKPAAKAATGTKSAAGTSGAAASGPAKAVQSKTVKAVATSAGSATSAGYTYADNLEGWIRESLDIMAREGIPGTFDGIYRNVMRESSGNPRAINNWDSNAAAGTPSKGLLQVIDPTFSAYHVAGTSFDPYDPVANITAACNYAADRYGSIDNVFGAY